MHASPQVMYLVIASLHVLTTLINLAALAAAWRWQRNYPGPGWWALSAVFAVLAWVPYLIFGRMEGGFAVFFGTQSILTMLILMLGGCMQFFRKEFLPMSQIVAYALTTLISFSFTFMAGWPEMRIYALSIYALFTGGQIFWITWEKRHDVAPGSYFILSAAGVLAGMTSYRLIAQTAELTGHAGEWSHYFTTTLISSALTPLILITFSFGFIFALAGRYRQDMLVLQQRFEHEALHDPLTNLGNRRQFMEGLEKVVAGYSRYGHQAALIMIDIDHFKQVNDRYGHGIGDKVLQHVANRLSRHCRTSDQIARVGGEEFAILLYECDRALAINKSERIRKDLAEALVMVEGLPLRITASFGVSTMQKADRAATLFERADAALYRAKAAGRNRVIADESDEAETAPPPAGTPAPSA